MQGGDHAEEEEEAKRGMKRKEAPENEEAGDLETDAKKSRSAASVEHLNWAERFRQRLLVVRQDAWRLRQMLKRNTYLEVSAEVVEQMVMKEARILLPEKKSANWVFGGDVSLLSRRDVAAILKAAVAETRNPPRVSVFGGAFRLVLDTVDGLKMAVNRLAKLFERSLPEHYEELFHALATTGVSVGIMLQKLYNMPIYDPKFELTAEDTDLEDDPEMLTKLAAHFPREIGEEWTAKDGSELEGWHLRHKSKGKGKATDPEKGEYPLTVKKYLMAEDLLGPARYQALKEHVEGIRALAEDVEKQR